MIVRIMGEGQVRLDDVHFAELNKLDDVLLAEMEVGDGPGFRHTLHALLDKVRELGTPLPDDALAASSGTPWTWGFENHQPPRRTG